MPLLSISPISSGGVRSITEHNDSTIAVIVSSKRFNHLVRPYANHLRQPLYQAAPLTSTYLALAIHTEPIFIFISSAVRSPIKTLYFSDISDNSLVELVSGNLNGFDTTTPPRDMTAISERTSAYVNDHIAVGC